MLKRIDDILTAGELAELHAVADAATFVDGRISNPHNTAKNNRHLHDADGHARSAKIMLDALLRCEDFRNYAFPKIVAPPLITAYEPGMHYGPHADAAFMQLGARALRSDLSCTLFLSDAASYDGGALQIDLSGTLVPIKLPAGSLIVYPSTTLHEVTPVTRGVRRVGLTFVESRVADPERREWLYELNEVAALEGLTMRRENYVRLQRIQQNLLRHWGDHS